MGRSAVALRYGAALVAFVAAARRRYRRRRSRRAVVRAPSHRDASLGPALTDKEKAAQQAARDSIAKEKARKKKRVRTNEHSERHKERLRALISEALLEVQRDFIKILEKQDMCRVDGVTTLSTACERPRTLASGVERPHHAVAAMAYRCLTKS